MDHFNSIMILKWMHLVVWLLQVCEGSETTILSVSSPGVVSVCPGKQLSLVCTVNHSILLTWAITLPESNNTQPLKRSIPYDSEMKDQPSFNLTPDTTFHFTRISESGMFPLIAEVLIDRVSTNLNGTDVQCIPLNDSDPQTTFAIHILGENSFHPPEVEMDELAFQITNFTIILNWAQEARVSYSISIDPLTEIVPIMNNSWTVTGNYDTPYNVSIEATLCDNYRKTTNVSLEYATCELLTKESLGISLLMINSTESRNPPVIGDIITFSCLSGELMGPKMTTCQRNGDWEPDPSGVMCNQVSPSGTEIPQCQIPSSSPNGFIIPYNSTDEKIRVIFACQSNCDIKFKSTLELHTAVCTSNGDLETNPLNFNDDQLTVVVTSSTAVLLVSSVTTFIVGFICGQWFNRKFKEPLNQASGAHPPRGPPVPIYESIIPDTTHAEQAIELEENVAYGPAPST